MARSIPWPGKTWEGMVAERQSVILYSMENFTFRVPKSVAIQSLKC